MTLQLAGVPALALLLLLTLQPVAADIEGDFNRGVEFFQAGDYASAIVHFESARAQGMDSVALNFNLASSYYKQQNYSAAETFYKKVAEVEEMKALAQYNLGLIALKQQNDSLARSYFRSVIEQDDDPKLASLARSQLAKIGPEQQLSKFFIALSSGYDDNITASPDDSVSGISDSFYDAYLFADVLLAGKRVSGWLVDASYYNIDFSDSDSNDEYQWALGLSRTLSLSDWNATLSLHGNRNNFAGEDYQSATILGVKADTKLAARKYLYLRYRYEEVSSEQAPYDYLQGWRQRARFEYRSYGTARIVQLVYEIEINDREELVTSTYAYDYSPTRQTLLARYTHLSGEKWRFGGELSYRDSDYPASASFDRNDDLWKAVLFADYHFNPTVKLTSKIRYTDNASTVDRYDYDKSTARIGINMFF